jgi:hypothetical protein
MLFLLCDPENTSQGTCAGLTWRDFLAVIHKYVSGYDSINKFIHSSMDLQPFIGPCPLLQSHNHFYTDGRTPWTSDQPVARSLPTHRTTQNKSMPFSGIRTHDPSVQWANTIRSIDRAATVIDLLINTHVKFNQKPFAYGIYMQADEHTRRSELHTNVKFRL